MAWDYPYCKPLVPFDKCVHLSGIEINQNQPPADSDHGINPGFAWYYQQFQLPSNFVRGENGSISPGPTGPPVAKGPSGPPDVLPLPTNAIIPQLSGIQVKTQLPKHLIDQATIDYTLDWQQNDTWVNLAQGTSIGASVHGDEVWFDIYFEAPVDVTKAMLNAPFRFGVRGRQPPPPHKRHKCLPIRRWNNKWWYYNYFPYYGLDFDKYGYDPFYANYPYYEWGYYGFPYHYNWVWWGAYWGDYYGIKPYLPWNYPYGGGWNFPYGYHNNLFYTNWYWYYYGYPWAPYNMYWYFRDYYLPQTEDWRWWHHWDEWDYDADNFPIYAFDDDILDALEDLEEETPYPIIFEGYYCYVYKHAEPEFDEQWGFHHKYCLHTQFGIPWLWFSYPNPYVRQTNTYVTDANENQVLQNGDTISFMFRLMTLTADSGQDDLGQEYRSTVVIHSADNLNTQYSPSDSIHNWYSKPNPSKFAVESLYFDISDADNLPQVVDRLFIDPITAGPYFSIYYSDDGAPAATPEGWENKIWNRVPKTYQLTQEQSVALPAPITAKYICLEFTHLTASQYKAPDMAQPIIYKKHPKWVLDYFMLRLASTQDTSQFLANSTSVNYNALDLAYNYYLDDLNETPDGPPNLSALNQFFANTNDLSDKIDATMARQISTIFQPYLTNPTIKSDPALSITQYAIAGAQPTADYQSEIDPSTQLPQITNLVSSLNRDQIILEQSYPVMYFYLPCKHVYRLVSANFSQGVSYQVGIRSLAFQREHYTVEYDSSIYIENGGDAVNIERNDLVRVDNAWAVYAKASS